MAISLSSPVTGTAQTGLTSPTYTVISDTSPSSLPGKQWAVSATGGTQTGVTVHSVSSPFTVNFTRPSVLKTVGVPNPATGVISRIPTNEFHVITRKGVVPAANQAASTMTIKTTIAVPAGADVYDVNNVRAALSLHLGALSQQSAGEGDLLLNGVL
ncbi:coat protein [ssRNA phage SRR6960551_1]|uniref:Coat protein n=1 Tax=ssRNA phage SRR6960551_1 TaxID=2786547 RepID=A0A8S5L4J8_9VIRU|nr:coat protein [ssRNA phage SRR6960551_1]DAD52616.1 TPA_asm: coat protein [ssRNA phage SRR6960551_1]